MAHSSGPAGPATPAAAAAATQPLLTVPTTEISTPEKRRTTDYNTKVFVILFILGGTAAMISAVGLYAISINPADLGISGTFLRGVHDVVVLVGSTFGGHGFAVALIATVATGTVFIYGAVGLANKRCCPKQEIPPVRAATVKDPAGVSGGGAAAAVPVTPAAAPTTPAVASEGKEEIPQGTDGQSTPPSAAAPATAGSGSAAPVAAPEDKHDGKHEAAAPTETVNIGEPGANADEEEWTPVASKKSPQNQNSNRSSRNRSSRNSRRGRRK